MAIQASATDRFGVDAATEVIDGYQVKIVVVAPKA